MNMLKMNCVQKFEIKAKEANGDVIIEGYANKAIVDDAKDLIPGKAWDTSRFEKNSMVLFNHNPDYPIGKCESLEQKEDGLWCKVRISKSASEKIMYVRDLIAEGILSAFSVGFEAKEQQPIEGINTIVKAKLHEISVVSLPMNEDSLFSSKAKKTNALHMKNWKSLREARKDVLTYKGAWVASEVHEAIFEALEEGKTKDEMYAAIEARAEISHDEMLMILAGEVTPVPEKVLEAIALELGMNYQGLVHLNQGDVELQPISPEAEPIDPSETPAPIEPAVKPEDEKAVEAENAFQACVQEKVPKLIEEGKEQEEAVAIAIGMCSQEKGCVVTEDMKRKAIALLLSQKEESVPLGNQDPNADVNTGNPHLELMKQQVVLLGTIANKLDVINESIAKLASSLAGKPKPDVQVEPQESETTPVAEADQETAKSAELDLLTKALDNIESAIKKIGL